jgi:cytochrome c553
MQKFAGEQPSRYPVNRERRGFVMKHFLLGIFVSMALIGCSDDQQPAGKDAAEKQPAADIAAGKVVAERDCKGCHSLDGKGVAPGIPNLAGQWDRYLIVSLQEYKDRKRTHGALRDIASHLSEAETRNVAAYFASLPPIAPAPGQVFSPFDHGKALAPTCTKCHGDNGNSKTAGVPDLAGQQPHYFVAATQEYLNGARETSPMHSLIRGLNKVDLDSVALFFASQTPAQRPAPSFGSPPAGEPLTRLCAGCHGAHGVSSDSATPGLASQDAQYLVNSIKAYRNKRRHEAMQLAIAALSDKDIENIAAFYTVQRSRAAEDGQTLVRELTDRCNRCHSADTGAASVVFPRINGQDKDYLTMALRAYRDGRRQSSVMHNMSVPYGDAIVESLASFYAAQAPKKSK